MQPLRIPLELPDQGACADPRSITWVQHVLADVPAHAQLQEPRVQLRRGGVCGPVDIRRRLEGGVVHSQNILVPPAALRLVASEMILSLGTVGRTTDFACL